MRQIVGLLALVVAACKPGDGSPPAPDASASSATASPAPTATATATSVPATSGARSVQEETDDFLFEYAYPKQAGQIAPLAALLDARLNATRDGLVTEAAGARSDARAAGFPYNKHSAQVKWEVVADLPGWLSLSSDIASYTGGAHGNYGFDSLVWDKTAGKAFRAIDLLQSPAALDKALAPLLCEALQKERAKRRGEELSGSVDAFYNCVPVKDATVLLGSRGKRKFDRITVQYGPYAAGPYAEGAYEIDLSVNRAVLEVVKPEFKDAFATRN